MFWTPAFAGVTAQKTFYEIINYSAFEEKKIRPQEKMGPMAFLKDLSIR
jgi:hypothetical protein